MQIFMTVLPDNKPINKRLGLLANCLISFGIFLLSYFKFKKAVSELEKNADNNSRQTKSNIIYKYILINNLVWKFFHIIIF